MECIWFILVGLTAGWLSGKLMKSSGFGIMGNIIIGIVGSVLGGCLFHFFGVSMGGGIIGSIIVATIGAVALIFTSRIINHA